MNSKILKACLAGGAAVALLGGGSTFASWSDWQSLGGSTASASRLALHVDTKRSLFPDVKLAPGQDYAQEIYVASDAASGVPGQLSLALTGLVDKENGCSTSSTEQIEDPDCDSPTAVGDLSKEVLATLASYPLPSGADPVCTAAGYTAASAAKTVVALPGAGSTLKALVNDTAAAITTLKPGQAACVHVGLSLPTTATNASQGDSVAFTAKFNLKQVLAAGA